MSSPSVMPTIQNPLAYPHPHRDPRQPLDGAATQTNPPVFVGPYGVKGEIFRLVVSTNADLQDPVLNLEVGRDPIYLPTKAFAPGTYYWKWVGTTGESPGFSFQVAEEAVVLEVPEVSQWLQAFGKKHPRFYFRNEDVDELRESHQGPRKNLWRELEKDAGDYLKEPHHMPEPGYLPDVRFDAEAHLTAEQTGIRNSRLFTIGATILALAYLASGKKKYARAACARMVSIAKWDPDGATHLAHQDETHMSVIMHAPMACDWVWDIFTSEEKTQVIAQFRRRGEITYAHMHDSGCFGINRFDNHSVREVVFLANVALIFHDEIPEAETWLTWLRPILCGVWPTWGHDDGSWAEGFMYGCTYMTHMSMFITALDRGIGVNLFRRPFWANNLLWRQWTSPVYAKDFLSFGDGNKPMRGLWKMTLDLARLVYRATGAPFLPGYIAQLEREIPRTEPGVEDLWYFRRVSPLAYLCGVPGPLPVPAIQETEPVGVLTVFPEGGWGALRTAKDQPRQDIGFVFRSSPYGNFSHSHSNQNDFALHVGGETLLQPSGYYDGWGTNHQAAWVWPTKSHNCLTLSDAGQLLRSPEARGALLDPRENENFAYFQGNGDLAYQAFTTRCRRHVFYFKAEKVFLLLDEVWASAGMNFQIQWNAHSIGRFEQGKDKNRFCVRRGKSSVEGAVLYHENAFVSHTEGFDPPFFTVLQENLKFWGNQHHFRFTATTHAWQRHVGVLLAPGLPGEKPCPVELFREGDLECSRFGGVSLELNLGERWAPKTPDEGKPFLKVKGKWGNWELSAGGLKET